jgi:GNAT superfamily N-acetyltransferase
MIIRKGTENDLDEIISLLKISLGEELTPKNTTVWNWKHRDNPFGKSLVLVAELDKRIIGVRAFIKWEYIQNGFPIPAQRAVDTAVHPDFQGKGIFSQLTRQLLEKSKFEGTKLIFNTPNKKSVNGYLKLGWEKWARLPISFKLNFFNENPKTPIQEYSWEKASAFINLLEKQNFESNGVKTNIIKGYLNWRYRDCPIASYKLITDYTSYLLIYRLKESKWGKELRICDFLTLGDPNTKSLSLELREVESWEKPRFVTFSGLQSIEFLPNYWKFTPKIPLGPVVTLKQLNPQLQPLNLPWSWSLGDLEVF